MDQTIRDLERQVKAGNEQAKIPLIAALARAGDWKAQIMQCVIDNQQILCKIDAAMQPQTGMQKLVTLCSIHQPIVQAETGSLWPWELI